MAGTIVRGKAIRADLALWDGKAATYSRINATGGTVTGLAIGNEVDVLQVFGSGTDRTRATINNCVNYIGSSNVTLIFTPGTWTIDANQTIGSNFTCRIPSGCVFSVESGVTLTFSGDVIVEDNDGWYTGSGTVVVSRETAHGATWHRTAAERSASVTPSSVAYEAGDVRRTGATGDNSTNDYTSINNSLSSATVTRLRSGHTYNIGSSTLSIPANKTLVTTGARLRTTAAASVSYADGAWLEGDDTRAYIGTFAAPADLGHTIGDFLYRRKRSGDPELLVDLSPYLPTGARDPFDVSLTRYYVDPDSGNDASAGTSWATALKTMTAALAKADVDVILCKGGTLYHLTSGTVTTFPNYSTARDVAVVAVGKPALMTTAANITSWSANGTYPSIYDSSNTSGTVVRVVDTARRDDNGDYFALTEVASLALCNSTSDSWYYSANVVTVNLSTGAPSVTTTLGLKVSSMRVTAAGTKVYIKNCHFLGGSSGAFNVRDTGSTTTYVTFEDCWFSHQYQLSGLQVLDCGMVISINCRASANGTDGFNYNDATSINPDFIEINCVGVANNQSSSSNGSSAHADCRGIRINCDYYGNGGPGIHDIETTKTLNINVTSRGQSGFTANSMGITASNTAEMWIDGGVCADNDGNDIDAENTATMHIRDVHTEDRAVHRDSGATIDNDFS